LADLADYQWLTSPAAAVWLEELANSREPVHRALGRLRKILTAEQARLVVQQAELRTRAVAKFGDQAAQLFFSDLSLQQATDARTAHYKASRVPAGSLIADYCCGIGGDLLALAQRGPTTGWDQAAELVQLASANLRALGLDTQSQACVGQVEAQPPEVGTLWHLDPDRRSDGRRSTQIEWHSPGPELVDRWLATNPQGLLKLAPAARVPEAWAEQAEREWISHDRQCRQQVVWFGQLATAQRRATVVPKTLGEPVATFVGEAECVAPRATSVARYLYDTDPSIRAAGLTGALALDQQLEALNDGAAYLTGDRLSDHPLLAPFVVREVLPLRVSLLAKQLRSLGIGRLEIKKRGVATEPERLRQQLKLRGERSATLLLTRLEEREIAILADRNAPANLPAEG
jgi:hypothetical protein